MLLTIIVITLPLIDIINIIDTMTQTIACVFIIRC